jgi:multidrug transporter EmrE-like cation transporter
MIALILAVIFTVSLFLLMRGFPRFGVNSLHAVIVSYYSCVITGVVLLPNQEQLRAVVWSSQATLLTLALGTVFVATFLLIGQTTLKVGVTAASLASNMALIVPVLFGLFVFRSVNKEYTALNYLGLALAMVAVGLVSIQTSGGTVAERKKSAMLLPLVLFAVVGTNGTLINFLNMRYYGPEQSALFTAIACMGSVVVGTTLLTLKILLRGDKLTWRSVVGGLLLGVPNALSLYFLLAALRSFGNSAAFVFPIFNILCMLGASAAAWMIFKERLQPLNRLGLALAVGAIVLLSYQEIGSIFTL